MLSGGHRGPVRHGRMDAGAHAYTAEPLPLQFPDRDDAHSVSDGDDAGKFRTALYWERAFELCYEGMRKYDLLRWGILAESLQAAQDYIAGWVPGPNEYITDEARDSWNGNTWANSNYIAGRNFQTGKHELFPIPLTEIQTNSALNGENNPGY